MIAPPPFFVFRRGIEPSPFSNPAPAAPLKNKRGCGGGSFYKQITPLGFEESADVKQIRAPTCRNLRSIKPPGARNRVFLKSVRHWNSPAYKAVHWQALIFWRSEARYLVSYTQNENC